MENLIISFNVVLPLFLCIMLGYFLRRIHMVDTPSLNKMNQLCFKVFLPIYLFNNIATTNLSAAFNAKLLAVAVGGLVGQFFLLMLLIPKIEKENSRRGVLIQAIFRSNFALFGLPVALSLCGTENIGPTSLLVGLTVPVFNILAVVTLESFRGGKPSVKKMLKGIATNPLIIASLIGIVFNVLQISLPSAVQKSVTDLGGVATPLSLVALGGSFTVSKVKEYRKQLAIGVSGRLVFSPLLMISIGIAMGFRNENLIPLLIMSGAPTAVSSFPMAQQMDGDGDLAAGLVVFSSGLAILTMFLWIFVLKQGGVI
ncbi:MAG: AEC family transporter [Lachnospiraceae bacterium]|nr:AEC family transporter [Lachnospiraceae bacterium]MBP3611335.1 AEC family transporter [Lachnospiraceae bacterium]